MGHFVRVVSSFHMQVQTFMINFLGRNQKMDVKREV